MTTPILEFFGFHFFPWMRKRLQRPILTGLVAALAMVLISLFIPNKYTAEGRILPSETKANAGGMSSQVGAVAAMAGVAVPGSEGPDVSFVDVLKSNWLRKKVLFKEYEFTKQTFLFGKKKPFKETLYKHIEAKNLDRAYGKMANFITISKDLRTKLLTIKVETDSAELSKEVVQQCLSCLEEFIQTKKHTQGGDIATFTAQRLAEARATYRQVEGDYEHFIDLHRNYQSSSDPYIRMSGLRFENELKLRQQVVSTLTLTYEQALIQGKNDIQILNILDDGDLPQDKSGPSRSIMVLMVFFCVGGVNWFFLNQTGLRSAWEQKVKGTSLQVSAKDTKHKEQSF